MEKASRRTVIITILGMLIMSAILLFATGPNKNLPLPWNYISQYIGWLYFCAWSISFYPQAFLNYRRKSVVGLSFDFLAYNLVAFTCYTIYNFSMLYVPEIQREYQEMFHQHVPVVINDLFFSGHATLITLFTITQCFFYERNGQRVSNTAIVILCLFFVLILLCILGVVFHVFSWLNWLLVIIVFSNIKLVISFIKYIPQLVFNFRRKSTCNVGWTIYNVLLDFSGGFLSIVQFFMNCAVLNEWSGLKSNLVKLGLGSVSMFFDILFMIQHYVLYPNHEETSDKLLLSEVITDSVRHDSVKASDGKEIDIRVIKTP